MPAAADYDVIALSFPYPALTLPLPRPYLESGPAAGRNLAAGLRPSWVRGAAATR
jgi:hypothetical protein